MNVFRTDPCRTYLENPTRQADDLYDWEQRCKRHLARRMRRVRRRKLYKKVRIFLWRKP